MLRRKFGIFVRVFSSPANRQHFFKDFDVIFRSKVPFSGRADRAKREMPNPAAVFARAVFILTVRAKSNRNQLADCHYLFLAHSNIYPCCCGRVIFNKQKAASERRTPDIGLVSGNDLFLATRPTTRVRRFGRRSFSRDHIANQKNALVFWFWNYFVCRQCNQLVGP
jgi:hypothetical protein